MNPNQAGQDRHVDAQPPPSRIPPPAGDAHGSGPALPPDPAAAAKHERRLRNGAEALPTRVPWRAVIAFVAIAVIAGWAVCLPLWFAGGLEAVDPIMMQLLLIALMFTPTLAALVVVFLIQRPKRPVSLLGLRVRPIGRTILITAIAWVAPPLLVVGGVLLASAIGAAPIDLTLEAFRQSYVANLAALGQPDEVVAQVEALPAGVLAATMLGQTLTLGVLLSSLPAFGEELGWRGWLLPALRPLGTWPAIVISCVVWGLWHAPIILLGYNFQDRGPLGLLMMIGFCLAVGLFVSWVRLRSASVYPAAIAHGSINATTGAVWVVMVGDVSVVDPIVGLVGWTLWVPFIVLAALLVLIGQFRRQPLPGLSLAESAMALQRAASDPVVDPGADSGADHPAT
ncbi:abortive infection protein [Pseudoclavibacter endophyticus]|uniref:CPBP family intramembrane metalloprotease n=1 Tax=Pseudoclavibacter endophyticus TaxID=1778590 RepID=A0A6H9WNQ4_9MICO|nr:type II CAAX endopeptidase family protein [Pseudoclavibacter endophyticus]KAB1646885.1 CPBP family intramembrane metalloprotease [Pseudoclavibacter endophyticus]GGA74715.1 abortive infection protein [Pseudoclavibacter endophyticus]